MRKGFLILVLCLVAPLARAHPHVFVDVGLELQTDDQGRLAGVEVTWAYDPLFSMLILSDRGLDADGDMVLTDDEKAQLLGFDLADWPEGFDGALFIDAPDGRLALGAPRALSVEMRDDRLVTRHFRPLAAPAPMPERLQLRPYDPFYYAALELAGAVRLPEGCTGEIAEPDRARAEEKLDSLTEADDESIFDEVRIGIFFAYTLEVTCAPRS